MRVGWGEQQFTIAVTGRCNGRPTSAAIERAQAAASLAEQSSQETAAAQLVLVRSGRLPGVELKLALDEGSGLAATPDGVQSGVQSEHN